jgi:hypothetical protein
MAYRPLQDVIGGSGLGTPIPDESVMMDAPPEAEVGDISVIDDVDGGATVIIEQKKPGSKSIPLDLPFDANLAEYIDDSDLSSIGQDVKEMVTNDIETNTKWRDDFNNGLKFLGFTPEDRDWVFKGASGAWDTKLLEGLIRLHAEIFGELFPAEGPADCRIIGEELPPAVDQASRIKAWTNYYLTRVAKEYYDDSDQMLNYAIMAGSAFRKSYICPVLRRPVAKYLTPNNVAMSYNSTSIYDAERFTHIDDVTPRNMKLLQIDGFYRDVDLPIGDDNNTDISKDDVDQAAGMEKTSSVNDRSFGIYETMLDYDLPNFEHPDGLPLPYKITIDSISGEVLRIERNWKQKKAETEAVYEKKLNVSHWKFMPGFGPFGIGIIQCLGGSTESRTKIKRMLHDSGVFSNFPPTIRVKGMRMEHNSAALKPGENVELDTGGMPINQAVQQMAVKEPSLMLKTIHDDDGQAADRLIGNMDIAVGDGRQDAPVGTTIALLQAAKKPQTGVMRRMHRALTHELENFFEMFGEWLPDAPYPFPVAGAMKSIMRQDFAPTMMLTPVSDPNVMSQTERMLRSEQIMKISMQIPPNAPPYQIEAARRMFSNMKIDNVDKLLPPPPQQAQPEDPVTENMGAMTGKPMKAFIQQNHDAHIAVHGPLAEAIPAMQAHISEHQSMKYRLIIENTLGFPLPPEGAPIDPMIQERIAMLSAAATQKWTDDQKAKNPPPPTMEQIMMADIDAKREKENLRHSDAMAKIQSEAEIQNIKSDDAAAQRAVELDKVRLKTMADVAQNTPSGLTPAEKVAHISGETSIAVARIKAGSTTGEKEYEYEKKKGD